MLFHGRAVRSPTVPRCSCRIPRDQAAFPQARTQCGSGVADRPHPCGLQLGGRCSRRRWVPTGQQPANWPCSARSSTYSSAATSLADRFFCSYWVIADLQHRGVDVVVRLHQRRQWTSGAAAAGSRDREVTWRAASTRVDESSRVRAMPAELTVRVLRVRSRTDQAGPQLEIVTTLRMLVSIAARGGDLFRQRWNVELYIRTLNHR